LIVVVRGLAGDVAREHLVGHVAPFEAVVGEEALRLAAELVGAALHDEVEADAAGALLDVVAAGGDLDFLERVVVEVARRGADRRHVGDLDAIEIPGAVRGPRALADERGLLTRLVPRDVHAIHDDAGDGAQQRPRVAGVRDPLELGGREVRRRAHLLVVDDRRLARDGDRLLDGGDPQRHGQVDVLSDAQLDVVAYDGGESLERDGELVVAGRQVQEPELAGVIAHGGIRTIRSLERDGHAGEYAALLVGYGTGDVAGGELRGRGCAG
jgi:hypothetical protein